MQRPARIGEWLIDPKGEIGMVMDIVHKNCIALQYVHNGNLYWHFRSKLRPAAQAEIDAAGFSGVGCVEPLGDC